MSEAYKAAMLATHLSDLCNENAKHVREMIAEGRTQQAIAYIIVMEGEAMRYKNQLETVKALLRQETATKARG